MPDLSGTLKVSRSFQLFERHKLGGGAGILRTVFAFFSCMSSGGILEIDFSVELNLYLLSFFALLE